MPLDDEDRNRTEAYFAAWDAWVGAASRDGGVRSPRWAAIEPAPPIGVLQAAAVGHPDARVRRRCLEVLDHEASDVSGPTFRQALGDPVPAVRVHAVHGLACERCRSGPLCATDLARVAAALLALVADDPSPKVRHAAVAAVAPLVDRHRPVRDALDHVAAHDPDPLVRIGAGAARAGRLVPSRRALRRRHRAPAGAPQVESAAEGSLSRARISSAKSSTPVKSL